MVALLIIGWVIWYVRGHLGEFGEIRIVSLADLSGLIILTPIYFFTQAILLKIVLLPFGRNLRFREWFGLTMVTMMGNFIFPFSGLGFRAIYLKKIHLLDYRDFVSSLSAIWLFNWVIFTFGGLISLLLLNRLAVNIDVTIFLGVVFLVCLAFLVLPFRLFRAENRLVLRINLLIESWQKIKQERKLIFGLVYWSVVELFLYAAMFYFAFRSLGLEIGYVKSFLPASLANFSLIVRFLPGSLGTYEGTVIYAAKILGSTIAQGISVVIITRLVSFVWIFLLGAIFSFILKRK